MARPLDILSKMLDLEAKDYRYQDRAVAGGLARYADTWRGQALSVFGDEARSWVDRVADLLEAYSEADVGSRPDLVETAQRLLDAGPSGHSEGEAEPDAQPVDVAGSGPPQDQANRQQAPPAPPPGESSAAEPRAPVPVSGAGDEGSSEVQELDARSQPEQAIDDDAPEEADSQQRGLDASVKLISGIGEKRAALLSKVGVTSITDFLHYAPRRYEDYSQLKTIDQLKYGERVSVLATVWETSGRTTHRGKYVFHAILSDATGTIKATWFGPLGRGMERRLRRSMQVLISGKVGEYLGRLTMNSPEWEVIGKSDITNARIQPVYPLTQGLSQRWMRSTMRRALSTWADRVPDPLPSDLRLRFGLLSLPRALWGVHLPDSQEHLAAARRRLAFEQTLYLQLGLVREKRQWKSQAGRVVPVDAARLAAVEAALPYELTQAQRRSLNEMVADLASGEPMHRLLQGDVGSGKTVVAALLAVLVADHGYQAALMAPTEILAEQHFRRLSALFGTLPQPVPGLALLTGGSSEAEREVIYSALEDGSLSVVVGTHALIQEAVGFRQLALAVIDEQHRFGVDQRQALRDKGYVPHLLAMTATPIPRSLELTVWGHVDVSVLDEMPPGRQPVRTRVLHPRERGRAYTFIESELAQGHQAFIIYPLVEASDNVEARAATDEAERLQRDVFPDRRVGLVHGRMRSDEKDAAMSAFSAGSLDVLIATSVIEVGIDVPNATVMLVDGADRFGLAQLHQFRGRVGRGDHQSYCLLLADSTSSSAMARLQALEATNDGFLLAEKDLEMRGPGEFLGTRQSGFPELPMAAFADTRMLRDVRAVAESLLAEDPELAHTSHRPLRDAAARFWQAAGDLD